jgi:hypothetical protein
VKILLRATVDQPDRGTSVPKPSLRMAGWLHSDYRSPAQVTVESVIPNIWLIGSITVRRHTDGVTSPEDCGQAEAGPEQHHWHGSVQPEAGAPRRPDDRIARAPRLASPVAHPSLPRRLGIERMATLVGRVVGA